MTPAMSAAIQDIRLRAGAAALAILALTSVHHAYGAVIYDTPWRLHILHLAVPSAVFIALALYIGRSKNSATRRIAAWSAGLGILAVPVAAISFYEGGYNHVVKNMIYFTLGEETARRVFAGELYEMPNDLVFEATGVAQFPLAVMACVLVAKLLRSSSGNASTARDYTT